MPETTFDWSKISKRDYMNLKLPGALIYGFCIIIFLFKKCSLLPINK